MCGLNGAFGCTYAYLLLFCFVTNMTARAHVFFIAMLSPNETVVQAPTPVSMFIFMIFSGYIVPHSSIPGGWEWLYWLSFMTYAVKGHAALNEFLGAGAVVVWTSAARQST